MTTANTDRNASCVELLERPFQTRESALRLVPVSMPTLDRAIREGDLRANKVGRRVIIPTVELLRWAGMEDTGTTAAL